MKHSDTSKDDFDDGYLAGDNHKGMKKSRSNTYGDFFIVHNG